MEGVSVSLCGRPNPPHPPALSTADPSRSIAPGGARGPVLLRGRGCGPPPPPPPPPHPTGVLGGGWGVPQLRSAFGTPTWGLHRTGAPRGSRRAEGGGSGGLGGSRWYTGSQCRARSHCCVGVPVAHGGPSGTWVAWWHVGVPMSCEGPIEIGWHGGVPVAHGGPSQCHVGVPMAHGWPGGTWGSRCRVGVPLK